MANNDFPFLEIKMSWSPEDGLQFKVFGKRVNKIKYVVKISTHTSRTLRKIPSGVLNFPAKLISC